MVLGLTYTKVNFKKKDFVVKEGLFNKCFNAARISSLLTLNVILLHNQLCQSDFHLTKKPIKTKRNERKKGGAEGKKRILTGTGWKDLL